MSWGFYTPAFRLLGKEPVFHCEVFRVPKNEAPKTKIPPALRVVGFALAYSRKPPML